MKTTLVTAFALALLVTNGNFGHVHPGLDVAASTQATNFNVTNNGLTNYVVDGAANPTLTLNQGSTYTFTVNATGHPFFIKTARVTGSGSQFTSGVTNNGVQVGTVTFVVPLDAPDPLFYQCGVHSAMGGTLTILGPLDASGTIPAVAWLGRAIPNPAHSGTSFRIGLPRDARVDVSMFDARGRRVRTLLNGQATAGEHTIQWDGRDDARRVVSSGAYFYRLNVAGRTLTGRVFVTR